MSLLSFFDGISDPRDPKKIDYPLINILFISVAATLAGARIWQDMMDFGCAHQDWLAKHLDMSHGVPSRYTFRRLFLLIDHKKIEQAFINWTQTLSGDVEGCQIALDGKALKGTRKKPLQINELQFVSAWCEEKNIVLAQVATSAKSNEIKAIPVLLDLLTIKGCLVSIDAAGCQQQIAAKIIEKGADYLLALKRNQPTLHHAVERYLQQTVVPQVNPVHDKFEDGHGRCVRRRVFVAPINEEIQQFGWEKLSSVIAIETITDQTGKVSAEWRYYISSKPSTDTPFDGYIRHHWGVENKLHWMLDVHLGDDAHISQERNSTLALSALKRVVLNLIRQHDLEKKSMRRKLLRATWDIDYLEKIMLGSTIH